MFARTWIMNGGGPSLPNVCLSCFRVLLYVYHNAYVGQNLHIYSVHTVLLEGKAPHIWPHTVYVYGSGQP